MPRHFYDVSSKAPSQRGIQRGGRPPPPPPRPSSTTTASTPPLPPRPVEARGDAINPFDFILGLYMGDPRYKTLTTSGGEQGSSQLLRILSSIQPNDLPNPVEARLKAERAELVRKMEEKLAALGIKDEDEEEEERDDTAAATVARRCPPPPPLLHRKSLSGQLVPYSEGQGRRKTAQAFVSISPAGTLSPGATTDRASSPNTSSSSSLSLEASLSSPAPLDEYGALGGVILINGRPLVECFRGVLEREHILRPLQVTGMMGRFDIDAKVMGGGKSSRAQAVARAVAQALRGFEPKFTHVLDMVGLVTADTRRRERKKPGWEGARRKFPWTKR